VKGHLRAGAVTLFHESSRHPKMLARRRSRREPASSRASPNWTGKFNRDHNLPAMTGKKQGIQSPFVFWGVISAT